MLTSREVREHVLQKTLGLNTTRVTERYLLDDKYLLRCRPVLAVPRVLVPAPMSLVHPIPGRPGMQWQVYVQKSDFTGQR